jgi:pimeloyl-ACP methyl ester carboxylesterase
MAQFEPFKISVPDEKINRLKQKLALAEYPTEADDADTWSRGPPLKDIRRLAERWANGYDWREAEQRLNRFPQYTTNIPIDGFGTFKVHFIHQRSPIKNAIPLCFVHGWPGGLFEVTKILPLLTDGCKDHPAFHVVAPSLINFGWSDECIQPGFNVNHHAQTCHRLMQALGYTNYVTQGGDLGYFTTHVMARVYPQHVKAWHVNLAIPEKPTPTTHPILAARVATHTLTARERADLTHTAHVARNFMGYYRIQATKPALISLSHTDSPIGLLSWLYDILHNWSDHAHYAWSDDEILTWVSIYYFSPGGIAASVRIYYESRFQEGTPAAEKGPVEPPLGIAHFPKEMSSFPRLWYETMGRVVHQREYEVGGHFAAWEQPEMLVGDLREMFGRGGGAEGVIEGASGYDEEDAAECRGGRR